MELNETKIGFSTIGTKPGLNFENKKIFLESSQWENFSITSMEVDFWRVKSSGCENSHATKVKCSNIPQKS
jgi:hypothetical protein